MAANHPEKAGVEETGFDAQRLATAFSDKLGITQPAAIDAHIAKYVALGTPLQQQDWCLCFSRCSDLLKQPPQALGNRLSKLQEALEVTDELLLSTVLKAPSLLQHDPQDIASKVAALQTVMALPDDEASAQLIIERFSRYPAILARPVEALESQLSGLAELLGTDLQRASRLAFKVPALAASSNDELQGHMGLLSRLLDLDMATVRALVLRQPSLLARTTEGLQSKVDAYAELFGQEHLGQALAAAPQLLTMKVEAVTARYELLQQLAQLQPSWTSQLHEASQETLAVWLCSSEKKLRRLEIAAQSNRLSRAQLYRLLSYSEGRWASEAAAAGVGPHSAADDGQTAAKGAGGHAAAAGGAAGVDDEHQAAAKPKRPRGGRKERERRERQAARQAAAGGRREREKRERREARAAAAADGADGDGHDAADSSQAVGSVNGQDFGAGFGPSTTGNVKHEGEVEGDGNGEGAPGQRPKRATRGGRREREKRERLAARLAAATATAAATAALDA
eukprot:gene5567-5804_t